MHDKSKRGPPDARRLFDISSEQRGFFTADQAHECAYDSALLSYHARAGRFIRVRRGLYRLRDYPSAPGDEVVAAWLAAGKDVAVASHESALDWLDLSDVIPDRIHLTLPRARRFRASSAEVAIHTVTQPLDPGEVITRDGVRLTSAARTIVDVAKAGLAPEQVITAIRQAVARGLATREGLELAAHRGGDRVERLLRRALDSEV